jgi:outer membrane translocation and assembly module TamA
MQPKNSTFSERQAASAAAKQALLAKFKPKAAAPAEAPIDHEAERRERAERVRQQREEEKRARQLAREQAAIAEEEARRAAAEAAERARLEAEHMSDAQKRAERKERKKAIKEAARAKKEVRSQDRPTIRVDDRGPQALDPIKEHERYIRSLERTRMRA